MEPKEYGCRTHYIVDKVANRATIAKQLEAYENRGYMQKVSTGENVYISPFLPVLKPDGKVRFTTDLRELNKFFSHESTTQVDA